MGPNKLLFALAYSLGVTVALSSVLVRQIATIGLVHNN